MRIERAEITVKVDLTGTLDYDAPVENRQARRFRPAFAMVSPDGDVHVFGHRVNARGIVADRRSVIEYRADPSRDCPEFVRSARELARAYVVSATVAWEAATGVPA